MSNVFSNSTIKDIADFAINGIRESATAASNLYDGLKNNMDDGQRRNMSLAMSGITSSITQHLDVLRSLMDNGHFNHKGFGHQHLDHIHRLQHAAWEGVSDWNREMSDTLPSYKIYSDLYRCAADLTDISAGQRPGEFWMNENPFGHWGGMAAGIERRAMEVSA